jgi:hypothetical protein
MRSRRPAHELTVDRHAIELKTGAFQAGLFKEGEDPDAWYDQAGRVLHFGPYTIPGEVVMRGVPATVSFMLNAKAEVEIAKQLAEKPGAFPAQDALYAEAHATLMVPPIGGLSATMIVVDERLPDVYGASYQSEDGVRRMSDWIQTFTGKKFHVVEPNTDDVVIEDIAHALSLVNRYTGHTRVAYSVAEHSIRVMWCVQDMVMDEINAACPDGADWQPDAVARLDLLMLTALLHDASEAYLADIARPIKMIPAMQPYRDLEKGLETVIAKKYGLPFPWPKIVKRADEILLVTEKRDLMGPSPADWVVREEPLRFKIEPWSAGHAEIRFLQEYRALMVKLGHSA